LGAVGIVTDLAVIAGTVLVALIILTTIKGGT
jgi:hypothetical protein